MDATTLEACWDHFLTNDVSVQQFLAIDDFDGDNAEFTCLQLVLQGSDRAAKAAAADALLVMMRDLGSASVLDGVVASAFDAVDQHAQALAIRIDALRSAASWHPGETSQLLGNIGYGLLKVGRLDEAQRWWSHALNYGVPLRQVDTSRNWKPPRDRVREQRP